MRYREGKVSGESRVHTTHYLSILRAKIEGTFNSSIYLTNALSALVASQGRLSWEDFDSVALALTVNSPYIRNVGLAEGFVIQRVYPKEGNEGAIGFDYRENADQWPSVERAVEERRTVVAGPLELIQGGLAVITRNPIYLQKPGSPDEQVFWGLSSVVIDFDRILRDAGLPDMDSPFKVAIRGKDGLGPDGEVFWGDPEVFTSDPETLSITFPNGSWLIAALPVDNPFHDYDSIILRGGSILIALLAATLTLVVLRDNERMRHLALHDALTGLPNRTLFEHQLSQTIKTAERQKRSFALAVLDLNDFKLVNDTYGHLAGDKVLVDSAARVRGRIRGEDMLARTGGDEFTLLIAEMDTKEGLVTVLEKLVDAIRQPFFWGESDIATTVSIGVALYPEDGRDRDRLFARADEAMYRAKSSTDRDWAVAIRTSPAS